MSTQPLISIITVCRNESKRIRDTADSVINQDFRNFEWIVIDGASIDGTQDLLKPYQNKISFFSSEPDNGIFDAQNKGAKLAKGSYLLFLNGGDGLANNNVLSKIAPFLNEHEIVYGDLLIERNHGQIQYGPSPRKVTLLHLLRSTIWHPTAFIKNTLYNKIGGFDLSYKIVSDYDFFLNAFIKQQCTYLHVAEPIAKFNTEGIGSSEKYRSQHDHERLASQKKYLSKDALELFSEILNESKHSQSVLSFTKSRVKIFLGERPLVRALYAKLKGSK